ncbi:MAG: hypothetical protein A3D65_00695 [Candidatus Lloydbacteria bacterium RIFCSPHIGHO2_02_FULL_50_13]|uniref:Tyr recombinase domain-containing protein n=1 Tax=Candidatus Lloydbacteria bacterium RIFCSPHIGHO2_02_FULL_50_13 TaxID=1798661 RepID=A0A1G2DAD7_9BACT|nr:MAG: hypothetical protein A3D65_00695 [Candidatus Lloydbacteria bacterium RIFCSPHIGHO2_02_FULL_50_13]
MTNSSTTFTRPSMALVDVPRTAEALERLFAGLDISQETKREYVKRAGAFLRYVSANGLTFTTLADYKRILSERADCSVSTKNKYLTVARVLLKEMHRRGALPVDITENVRAFSQSKKHRREGFDRIEIGMIAKRLRKLPMTARNERRRALFCLLALQGLRQVEVTRLDVGDIDFRRRLAFVRGKGRDDKEPVHLGQETMRILRRYVILAEIRDGALFRSMGIRKSERISTKTIRREMEAAMRSAGVRKTVHGFRHYYITTILKRFGVRDARKLSRHRSMEMLLVYDDEMDTEKLSLEAFECFRGLKVSRWNILDSSFRRHVP